MCIMIKKIYIQPTLEIIPFSMMNALCVSGETTITTPINEDHGGNPWTDGNAPHRTPVF